MYDVDRYNKVEPEDFHHAVRAIVNQNRGVDAEGSRIQQLLEQGCSIGEAAGIIESESDHVPHRDLED